MQEYVPKKLSGWQIASKLLRGIASLLRLWPLFIIAAFVLSPITPYMRWSYTYTPHGQIKVFHRCTYIGRGGDWDVVPYGDCPFVVLVDERNRSR